MNFSGSIRQSTGQGDAGLQSAVGRWRNVQRCTTFRVDKMPYGGVKGSGFGRKGLKHSIEEMTEIKLLVMNHYLD